MKKRPIPALATGLIVLLACGTLPAKSAPVATAKLAPSLPAAAKATEPRRVAAALGEALIQNYLFPVVAERYAKVLSANAAAGKYDAYRDPETLAERLTKDLQATATDGHLLVSFNEPANQGASPPRKRREPPMLEASCWIAPDVAYLKFNVFPGDEASVATVKRLMGEYSKAGTLILDVRRHFGGELNETDEILQHLYTEPTSLVLMDTRTAAIGKGGEFPEGPTVRTVSGPAGVVRREHFVNPATDHPALRKARVFVLTSGKSVSAAEHLAFVLKRTGRGTVVGEPTAGAGHYGATFFLGGGLEAFIPVGRTFDPNTGAGWEGTGVSPDLAVPAEKALSAALLRAGLPPDEAERMSSSGCKVP